MEAMIIKLILDCNPSLISYPIPGNDDDGAVADLVLEWAAKVINEGKQIRNSVSKLYEAHSSVRLGMTPFESFHSECRNLGQVFRYNYKSYFFTGTSALRKYK